MANALIALDVPPGIDPTSLPPVQSNITLSQLHQTCSLSDILQRSQPLSLSQSQSQSQSSAN